MALTSAWRVTLLCFGVIIIALFLGNPEATRNLAWFWWTSGTYGHAILVIPVMLWFIWGQRQTLLTIAPRPGLMPLLIVIALGSVLGIAELGNVQSVQRICLVLIPIALVLTLGGMRVFLHLLLPLTTLLFTIEIWRVAAPYLQDVTARISAWAVARTGIPVFLEAAQIALPNGNFEIEEACAGLRYLLAAMSIGAIYAYVFVQGAYKRFLIVFIATVVGVVFNWLRVYIIILVGFYTDMQHPMVHDHATFGWYLFFPVIVMLLLLSRWLMKDEVPATNTFQGMDGYLAEMRVDRPKLAVITVLSLLAVLSPALLSQLVVANSSAPDPEGIKAVMSGGDGARTGSGASFDWDPEFKGTTAVFQGFQDIEGNLVGTYLGHYARQSQGREVINDENSLIGEELWPLKRRQARTLQAAEAGIEMEVMESLYGRGRTTDMLIWHVYLVGGKPVTGALRGKILEVMQKLKGRSDAQVLAIATAVELDVETSRHRLISRLGEVLPALRAGDIFTN